MFAPLDEPLDDPPEELPEELPDELPEAPLDEPLDEPPDELPEELPELPVAPPELLEPPPLPLPPDDEPEHATATAPSTHATRVRFVLFIASRSLSTYGKPGDLADALARVGLDGRAIGRDVGCGLDL